MNLTLYYAPVACSLVPYVTLTEAGAPFEVRTINLGAKQQQSPEFLAVNPKHKVPVLVIDGKPLTENVAIQQWIADTFPEARLKPDNPDDWYRYVAMHGWCSAGIHPYLTRLNAPAKVCDVEGTADSVRRHAIEALHDNFGTADDMLNGRAFFFDHFTTADAYFFWCFRRAKLLDVDVSQFNACEAHFRRMLERPSVQKVLDFEAEVKRQFASAA